MTYETRRMSIFGTTDFVSMNEQSLNKTDALVMNILDSVPGLAKIIIGCFNIGAFTEYVRSPPIDGKLDLSDDDARKQISQRLIKEFEIDDQGWAVEYHATKESKETQFRDTAYERFNKGNLL